MKLCNCCGIEQAFDCFYRHRSYSDGYRSECKKCLKAKSQSPLRKAQLLASAKRWQAKNPEKVRALYLLDRARHAEKRNASSLKWRAENPQRHRDNVKAWQRLNPESGADYNNRRRTRLAGNGGNHTAAEWRERLKYFNNHCAYCLRHESECGRLTRDHVLSLQLGGGNDIENIVPACSFCNCTKGPRTLLRFIQLGASTCP